MGRHSEPKRPFFPKSAKEWAALVVSFWPVVKDVGKAVYRFLKDQGWF